MTSTIAYITNHEVGNLATTQVGDSELSITLQ